MDELIERRRITRVSWGGVFAGFFSGFGIWLMLALLGAAVGATALNPSSGSAWGALGKGAGIWLAIDGIIAVFCGGYIAARLSTTQRHSTGLLHGVTVWGLTLLVGAYGGWMLISGVAKTTGAVAGQVAGAAGSAVSGVVGSGAVSGQTVNTALAGQVNKTLRERNLPPVSPQQVQTATSELQRRAVSELARGQSVDQVLDQQTVSQSLIGAGFSRAQANAVSSDVATQLRSGLQNVKQTGGQALQSAGQTVQTISRAASWGLWADSLLMLIAAACGGFLGVRRERELPVHRQRVERVERERPPPLRPSEV
jgi:hypothetical protein